MSNERPPNIELKIDGKAWREWSEVSLTKSYDSVSSVKLVCPWDWTREDMREAFKPFVYQEIDLMVDGEKQFSGYAVTPSPESTPEGSRISITAYSKAGTLQDNTMPESAFPLEFNKLKVDAIARKLAFPFEVGVIVEPFADLGAAFERVSLNPDEVPWTFIADLTKQRGLILSSDVNGNLLIRGPSTGLVAAADLEWGVPPVGELSVSFNGQDYHSEFTAIATEKLGAKGGRVTEKNPRLKSPIRPHIFKADKSERGDLKKAAAGKFGRMMGNVVSWNLTLPTWRDQDGDLWEEGSNIYLKAPPVFIYEKERLKIRTVEMFSNGEDWHANMNLVLSSAFTDKAPEKFPWD